MTKWFWIEKDSIDERSANKEETTMVRQDISQVLSISNNIFGMFNVEREVALRVAWKVYKHNVC